MIFLRAPLIAILLRPVLALLLDPGNCGPGSLPCGPSTACCPSGYFCNFNIGIPACEKAQENVISGAGGALCADPYLYDCSPFGAPGYCCAIGTICFNDVVPNVLSCIDAYGNLTSPYPSATVGVVPPAIPVVNSDPNMKFRPMSAWSGTNITTNDTSCGDSRVTSVINSTISFNYTGPSIRVYTMTSQHGGVLSVSVDGFDTGETIDTFSNGSGNSSTCVPTQYPPFLHPPSGLAARNSHWITLTYIGPSPNAPNGTALSNVRFGSFSLPEFHASPTSTSTGNITRKGAGLALPASIILMTYLMTSS